MEPTRKVSKPVFMYFPVAGRGELARLIAAGGGLVLEETKHCENKAAHGSPGSLPCLSHGDLRIAQSFAIESYLASMAPKYKELSAAQIAKDRMFASIKEDMIQDFRQFIFDEILRTQAPREVPKLGDKWFPLLERHLPSDGFINGLDYPTPCDLALLNIAKAYMPFGAAYKYGNYDPLAKYPKFAAHVARAAQAPGVKEYLAKSASMHANPMGL